MVFNKAEQGSIHAIKELLLHFKNTTGLEMNEAKTALYMGGMDENKKKQLTDILGCELGVWPVKYLGVPLTASRMQIMHYKPLIEKVICRITSWEARTLSYVGRYARYASLLGSNLSFSCWSG